ncbi:MAG: hypothetical protein ACOCQB_03040 [Halanaerobiaceae bacterium]
MIGQRSLQVLSGSVAAGAKISMGRHRIGCPVEEIVVGSTHDSCWSR